MLAAPLLLAGCGPHYAPTPRGETHPPAPAATPAPTLPPPAPTPVPSPSPTPPPRLVVAEGSWEDLPGWSADQAAAAVPALLRSCEVWRQKDASATLGEQALAGTVADWLPLCDRLEALPAGDDEGARALFVELLRPVVVSNRGDTAGLFTGYYEPNLRGSRVPEGPYQVPLYVRPPELVSVELGQFRPDLKGKRIAGRVREGALVPYFDRAAIDQGALAGRGLELVWVDDPVAAFFLEIQGSGRVLLPDGSEMRLGYAAQNGSPYVAIGRALLARGALTKEQMSLQTIRDWLLAHPQEAVEVMRSNPSYIFFRELGGEGPIGSLGVPLTAERSLAVDPLFVPLGVPVWVDTTLPAGAPGGLGAPQKVRPLQRLMVAQDTGGAILGPVRGDLFWGHGDEAGALAGSMRQPGRLWLLLPKAVPLPAALTTLEEPAPPPT